MTEAKKTPQKWHIKMSITGPSKSNRTYAIPMETDGLRNSCRK